MSLIHKDRVLEISTTTGTGNLLLGGPQSGFYTFVASFGAGVPFGYQVNNPISGENEVGFGQIVDNGDSTYSLQRNSVERSSNANALVNFAGGRKYVANVLLASEADAVAALVNVILKDGSVAFTNDQSMGGHKLTHLQDPAAGTDACNLETAVALIAAAIGGAGNVTGPSPGVANAGAVIVDTTGKLLRNSTVIYHPVATLAGPTVDKPEFGASFEDLDIAADGATITFDFNQASSWQTTLGGNRQLAFVGAIVGQIVKILLYQDPTGNRTPVWWNGINWNNGLAPVIDPQSGGWNEVVLQCISNGMGSAPFPQWNELCRSTSAPRKGITTLVDGATVTLDPRVSNKLLVTIAGNRTLALSSSNVYIGQVFSLKIRQDATGSRLVTWWSGISWAGGVPTLSTTAALSDWLGFVCTGVGTYDGFVLGQGLA